MDFGSSQNSSVPVSNYFLLWAQLSGTRVFLTRSRIARVFLIDDTLHNYTWATPPPPRLMVNTPRTVPNSTYFYNRRILYFIWARSPRHNSGFLNGFLLRTSSSSDVSGVRLTRTVFPPCVDAIYNPYKPRGTRLLCTKRQKKKSKLRKHAFKIFVFSFYIIVKVVKH